MNKHTQIALLILLLTSLDARSESEVDYTGFWKENCDDAYGIQIMHQKDGLYTTRFCGPGGGCNKPPDTSVLTPIEGDPGYEVVSPTELREKIGDTVYSVLHKCTTDTNPELKYSEEHKPQENLYISCESSPSEAAFHIPDNNVSGWAKVHCTKYGHVILPSEGYIWSYYGGFAPIAITAQKTMKGEPPKKVGNSVYFSEIRAEILSDSQALNVATRARLDDSMPDKQLPIVYKLSTISSAGERKTIYFLQYEDRLSGAMPYPDWFERENDGKLLPFFIYDKRKSQSNNVPKPTQ